jgi:uncharacterized membrane protein
MTTALLSRLRRIPVLLTLVLSAAAALRLWHLGAKSLWYDEGFTVGMVRLSWSEMLQQIIGQSNMGLYYLLLRGWVLLGDSEWWLRFFTVLFAVISMVVFAAFAKRYFGNTVALVSTAIVTVFPLHVHYSRDVRSYGLLLAALAVSWCWWTDAMLHDRTRSYVGWIAFALAALYSHLFACLIFGAQIIAVLLLPAWRARLPKVVRAAACYAVGALPLAYCAFVTGAQQISWISYSSTSGFRPFVHEVTEGHSVLLVVAVAVFAVGVAMLCRELVQNGRAESTFLCGAVFIGAAFPVATILAVSIWKSCLLPRYVLMVVPFLAIAVSWTMTRLPKWASVSLFACLICISGLGVRAYFAGPVWNDFRGATFLIASRAEPGDALIVFGNELRPGVDYYREHRPAGTRFPSYVFPGTSERMKQEDIFCRPTADELDHSLSGYDHVWLLLEGNIGPEKRSVWQHFFLRRLATRFNLIADYGFHGVQVFEFRRDGQHGALGPALLNDKSVRLLESISLPH